MDAGLLVARDGELEAIRALLRGDGDHVRALVLEGEPGVGKTSLWEQGVAGPRARACGCWSRGPARPRRGSPSRG